MTDVAWSIEVELDDKVNDSLVVDDLMGSLKGAHAAIGSAPNGNLSVRISVDAHTAYRAFDLGTVRVQNAARENGVVDTILGVHLETEAELDRRLAQDGTVPINV